MTREILVLYYSRSGHTAQLARLITRGIEEVPSMRARLRQVPPEAPVTEVALPPEPADGAPCATKQDLLDCIGLAMGSPTRFGNMAAPLKHFLDSTGVEWASGALAGKPAARFTSTSTHSGGTPYDASDVTGAKGDNPISEDERKLARALGRYPANVARPLADSA